MSPGSGDPPPSCRYGAVAGLRLKGAVRSFPACAAARSTFK